jgi:hypothetical protein
MQRESAQEILDRADVLAAGARDEAESLLIAARRAIVDVSGCFFESGGGVHEAPGAAHLPRPRLQLVRSPPKGGVQK